MSNYDENEVRCKLTQLKYAIDSEQQDHEREFVEMKERIASLENDNVRKDRTIKALERDSGGNLNVMIFMTVVAVVCAVFAFMQAVWS